MSELAPPSELQAMLDLLGVAPAPPSVALLRRLQRAWALTQPFHNLDLLAGYGAGRPPLDRRGGWERCLAGLGGPCHVQASSFLFLLRGLRFDAHFASATISHPGDHLTVASHLEGRSWLSDVGNGHPYLDPLPFDQPATSAHLGWSMRTRVEPEGLLLEQKTPGASGWRRVYVASPALRTWDDFTAAIERHHREIGFGPFLTGLRAVRICEDVAWTLRNDDFVEHRPAARTVHQLTDEHAAVMASPMDLGDLPVLEALDVWRENCGVMR